MMSRRAVITSDVPRRAPLLSPSAPLLSPVRAARVLLRRVGRDTPAAAAADGTLNVGSDERRRRQAVAAGPPRWDRPPPVRPAGPDTNRAQSVPRTVYLKLLSGTNWPRYEFRMTLI